MCVCHKKQAFNKTETTCINAQSNSNRSGLVVVVAVITVIVEVIATAAIQVILE